MCLLQLNGWQFPWKKKEEASCWWCVDFRVGKESLYLITISVLLPYISSLALLAWCWRGQLDRHYTLGGTWATLCARWIVWTWLCSQRPEFAYLPPQTSYPILPNTHAHSHTFAVLTYTLCLSLSLLVGIGFISQVEWKGNGVGPRTQLVMW